MTVERIHEVVVEVVSSGQFWVHQQDLLMDWIWGVKERKSKITPGFLAQAAGREKFVTL